VASGERLLIRGREESQEFENGDFRTVARVDVETKRVWFTDGRELPFDFKAWTYGHGLTSYRAQGSTAEESLLVLGEVAERALMRRQFYVANTRFRGAHRIYVSHREAILNRLAMDDSGRELATEFMQRHRVVQAEEIAMRPLQRMGHRARAMWFGVSARLRNAREAMHENMEV
jgi:hypothetical protein